MALTGRRCFFFFFLFTFFFCMYVCIYIFCIKADSSLTCTLKNESVMKICSFYFNYFFKYLILILFWVLKTFHWRIQIFVGFLLVIPCFFLFFFLYTYTYINIVCILKLYAQIVLSEGIKEDQLIILVT